MSRLNVLHVIPSVAPSEGGPSVAVRLMERGLSAAGVNVVTLATDHNLIRAMRSPDIGEPGQVTASRIYCRKVIAPYKVAPGMVPWLHANIASFDVVHIHALFSFAPTVAAWAARLHGVPYVVRPLGTLGRYGLARRRGRAKQISLRLVERSNLMRAAAVHFTSQCEMDEARELGVDFRGIVIPLGVEKEHFASDGAALKRLFPQLAGRAIVLYLSRIDGKKNLEALIDAFAQSSLLKQRAGLVIAGSGDPNYVEALKQRAGNSDAEVVWLGRVDGAAKAAALRAADVFVLPSYSENFGIAVVEAMLAGLPVVVGRGVAIADEIVERRAGIAIEPSPAAIGAAIEQLTADGARARCMGENARTLAEERFSLEAMTTRLIELYESIRRPVPVRGSAEQRP